MNKIPTLYVRDPANMSRVTREVSPGCEWVLAGEGIPTRKWDGTNVLVEVRGGKCFAVNKRRNPTREEKAAGAEPGYVLAPHDMPENKHIHAAVDATDFDFWPDGDWSCEALGPKIQGGADGMEPSLIPFSLPDWPTHNRIPYFGTEFDHIDQFLSRNAIEGIVWHHADGRMAKIKRRDFGIAWPVR